MTIMSTINLTLDDDVVSLLRRDDQPLDQAALELIVLELYRRRTISSGRAAQVLGMGRADFIVHASRLGIPFFDMSEQEWNAEVARIEAS
jgi:hypothetical protein